MSSNYQSVVASIPLSNNTISSRTCEMVHDIQCMLIEDLKHCKFSFTLDESTFGSQSVLLGFVRYIKDASICQGILFIKTMK